jgi:Xaa-Pro aminopeptidase
VMPNALWEPLIQSLPDARFVRVYDTFRSLAAPQSAEEQAVLGYAAKVGDDVAQAMLEATKPGITEADVMAVGMAEAYRNGIVAPAMTLQSGPNIISWGGPTYAYRPRPPRTLAHGDIVLAEVFCSCGMRETHHQVTITIGDSCPDLERAATAARASYDAALD